MIAKENIMKSSIAVGALSAVLVVAAAALTAHAQSVPVPPEQQTGPASEASPMFQRHHAMAGIMKEMVQEMSRMQDELSKGEMSAQARSRMARDMKRMSGMMQRMSGWADRPTMKEPEMRRQYEQMRRQMDEMRKSHDAAGPK
jgi:hypothetical protein